jgi:hypothetical protein
MYQNAPQQPQPVTMYPQQQGGYQHQQYGPNMGYNQQQGLQGQFYQQGGVGYQNMGPGGFQPPMQGQFAGQQGGFYGG